MTKLKTLATIAASTLALGGVTMASTASAQPWHRDYDRGYDHDRGYSGYSDSRLNTSYVDGLAWKIDNARSHGMISWQQARELHMQLREVQPLAWRAQTGQARPWEIRRLENVVNRIDSITQGYAYNMRRPYYR